MRSRRKPPVLPGKEASLQRALPGFQAYAGGISVRIVQGPGQDPERRRTGHRLAFVGWRAASVEQPIPASAVASIESVFASMLSAVKKGGENS